MVTSPIVAFSARIARLNCPHISNNSNLFANGNMSKIQKKCLDEGDNLRSIFYYIHYVIMYTMSKTKKSTPEELAASRDTRLAVKKLECQESYLALLKQAHRIRLNSGLSSELEHVIKLGESEMHSLEFATRGKISPRNRTQKTDIDPYNRVSVFIDECGSHTLNTKDGFDAFVLAAVIIPDKNYKAIDERLKKWKLKNLGDQSEIIHEPQLRMKEHPFNFKGDKNKQRRVEASLNKLISTLDFTAIACIINKPEYLGLSDTMDKSLPKHIYLMTLDFLIERLVMVLDSKYNGARAHIIAEARGLYEDALLQYEYVRLLLDGTTYISPSWFRFRLATSIQFLTKKDNCTGLQIADLLARPCADIVLDPKSHPVRWNEFRKKLCDGRETAHSILGFKVMPWKNDYETLCKS